MSDERKVGVKREQCGRVIIVLAVAIFWLLESSHFSIVIADEQLRQDQNNQKSLDQVQVCRAVILVRGSVQLLLTNPEGQSSGFDPKSNKLVNDIANVPYEFGKPLWDPLIKQFAIHDLQGTWKLKIIGEQSGEYELLFYTLDKRGHPPKEIKKKINVGQVDEFLFHNPKDLSAPVEIIELTN